MPSSSFNGGAQFVSAQQVAERAGVSRSAVSRAFTYGASVAPDTRKKVMKAAEELGYQVNDLARGLLTNSTRLVGLVVTKPEVGFRALLVASLTKALIARGSVPMIINTGQSPVEMAAAQRALFGHRAEATIILSGSPPASFVDLARRNGQPLIVIGRSEPGTDHVQIDNASAAEQAVAACHAHGITRLGLAGSDRVTPSVVERETAFLAAASMRGIAVHHVRGRETDYSGGLDAARQFLDNKQRPQAIFCVNDLIAFGVLDYARQAGLSVPEDFAVIGFDDTTQASWLAYGLTTFRQDPETMAQATVAILDQRQSDPDTPPATVSIPAPLIVRQSFVPVAFQSKVPHDL